MLASLVIVVAASLSPWQVLLMDCDRLSLVACQVPTKAISHEWSSVRTDLSVLVSPKAKKN
jgi:hypothetical protein